jgi:hypothetical protein
MRLKQQRVRIGEVRSLIEAQLPKFPFAYFVGFNIYPSYKGDVESLIQDAAAYHTHLARKQKCHIVTHLGWDTGECRLHLHSITLSDRRLPIRLQRSEWKNGRIKSVVLDMEQGGIEYIFKDHLFVPTTPFCGIGKSPCFSKHKGFRCVVQREERERQFEVVERQCPKWLGSI